MADDLSEASQVLKLDVPVLFVLHMHWMTSFFELPKRCVIFEQLLQLTGSFSILADLGVRHDLIPNLVEVQLARAAPVSVVVEH